MRWVPFYLCRTTVAKLLCLYGIDCSCPHHWRDWLNFRGCLIDVVVCLHVAAIWSDNIIEHRDDALDISLLFCCWSQNATVPCMCTLYGA
jgi:hypothetical protein